MIKKILMTTFILLILWNIAIKFVPAGITTVQHQWNSNLILAQEYLYNTDVIEKDVMVGSSRAFRLKDSLPQHIISLTFGGQGIFDGLRLVNVREEKPKHLYIEMNAVLGLENETFQNYIFSPLQYSLRQYLPGLQVKNQPVGVLKGLVAGAKDESPAKKEVFNKNALERRRIKRAKTPSEGLLSLAFAKLKETVTQLTKSGVKVIFFEMPMHQDLCDSTHSKAIRNRFKKEFPENEYQYINMPDCSEYQTTDGSHLNRKDVSRYMSFFNHQVRRINERVQSN